MGERSVVIVPLLLWWHGSGEQVLPLATMGASSNGHTDISGPLLLAYIVVMGVLTSAAHITTNLHSSDRRSDISSPLLLACIVAMSELTSVAHCY
jgi:hypothetical protein